MFITFLVNPKAQQITWDDIMNNPYISFTEVPNRPKKKITQIVPYDYASSLWEKRKPNENIFDTYFAGNKDIIDGMITEDHYTHFQIPKKSNPHKMRQIDAPDDMLSTIQVMYKDILEKHLLVQAHKAAHAYVEKRSTVTAIQEHQKNNSKWFLQIDLKDFFNSIDGMWLKTMLNNVYPMPFIPEEEMDRLIKISLLKGVLPQGSHLSPLLTNLAMVPIDYSLTEKLHNYNKHHFVYTRYADDITISCKEKFDVNEILDIIKEVFNDWEVPFRINDEKTRFGSSAGRNYHLGLIINKDNQISVGHEKNQKFRAKIFNFCTTGEEWDKHDIQKMLGIISYYKSIEPDFVNKVLNKYGEKFNIDILQKAKNLIK